jgi:hypothetical protein
MTSLMRDRLHEERHDGAMQPLRHEDLRATDADRAVFAGVVNAQNTRDRPCERRPAGTARYFIVGMLKSDFSRTPPLGQRWVTVLMRV